jgi:hypothetical protein
MSADCVEMPHDGLIEFSIQIVRTFLRPEQPHLVIQLIALAVHRMAAINVQPKIHRFDGRGRGLRISLSSFTVRFLEQYPRIAGNFAARSHVLCRASSEKLGNLPE